MSRYDEYAQKKITMTKKRDEVSYPVIKFNVFFFFFTIYSLFEFNKSQRNFLFIRSINFTVLSSNVYRVKAWMFKYNNCTFYYIQAFVCVCVDFPYIPTCTYIHNTPFRTIHLFIKQ